MRRARGGWGRGRPVGGKEAPPSRQKRVAPARRPSPGRRGTRGWGRGAPAPPPGAPRGTLGGGSAEGAQAGRQAGGVRPPAWGSRGLPSAALPCPGPGRRSGAEVRQIAALGGSEQPRCQRSGRLPAQPSPGWGSPPAHLAASRGLRGLLLRLLLRPPPRAPPRAWPAWPGRLRRGEGAGLGRAGPGCGCPERLIWSQASLCSRLGGEGGRGSTVTVAAAAASASGPSPWSGAVGWRVPSRSAAGAAPEARSWRAEAAGPGGRLGSPPSGGSEGRSVAGAWLAGVAARRGRGSSPGPARPSSPPATLRLLPRKLCRRPDLSAPEAQPPPPGPLARAEPPARLWSPEAPCPALGLSPGHRQLRCFAAAQVRIGRSAILARRARAWRCFPTAGSDCLRLRTSCLFLVVLGPVTSLPALQQAS